MPLILLGLVFVVGLFVFYLFSTTGEKTDTDSKGARKAETGESLEQDENVIFLPSDIERAKKQHRKNKL